MRGELKHAGSSLNYLLNFPKTQGNQYTKSRKVTTLEN